MRKIKHWQGYGTVKAGVVKDNSCTLHIRVEGNHEYGINCGEWDEWRLFEWLVKRFDKTITDYAEWHRRADHVRIEEGHITDPVTHCCVDTCDYYFYY